MMKTAIWTVVLLCTLYAGNICADSLLDERWTLLQVQEPIHLMMDESSRMHMNFSIPCTGPTLAVHVVSDDRRDNAIYSVISNHTLTIECNLRTAALEQDDDVTLGANGSFVIELLGNTIGLSRIGIVVDNVYPIADIENQTLLGTYAYSDIDNDVITYNSDVIGVDGDVTTTGRPTRLSRWYPVTVFREMRAVDHIFRIVLGAIIVVVTMGFGCQLDLEVVRECVRRPVAPAIGLGCQYIVMPLVCGHGGQCTIHVLIRHY